MKTITVFTPTYNRAYCLDRCYNSLVAQSNHDFEWLVVDDGSTDNTKELVQSWINDNKIKIVYLYKPNQGMHSVHNVALDYIKTELNFCIDSDDYITVDAINKIINFWKNRKSLDVAGILALNNFDDGTLVCSKKFPHEIEKGKYSFLKSKYGIVGDVKFIFKTEVINKYKPYPIFPEEKLVPLGYKYRLIELDWNMLFLNEVVCVVEYMEDGSTKNMFRQYIKNPKGFAFSRLHTMNNMYSIKDNFMQTIHFVAESFLGKTSLFKNNNNKLFTVIAIPFGFIFYFYLIYLKKKVYV